jgi:hypothetical protein
MMEKVKKIEKTITNFKIIVMTKKCVSKSYFSKSDFSDVVRIGIDMGIL